MKLNFRHKELKPFAHLFYSQKYLKQYQQLFRKSKKKQSFLDKNPGNKVFADIVDNNKEGFTYEVPRLDDPRLLLVGEIVGTCLTLDGYGKPILESLLSDPADTDQLMLVLDAGKEVVGYCRYYYDAKNKGIGIEQGHHIVSAQSIEAEVLDVIRRGIFDQMNANNKAGVNPVERINSHREWLCGDEAYSVADVDGVYCARDGEIANGKQYVLHGPELERHLAYLKVHRARAKIRRSQMHEPEQRKQDRLKAKKIANIKKTVMKKTGERLSKNF